MFAAAAGALLGAQVGYLGRRVGPALPMVSVVVAVPLLPVLLDVRRSRAATGPA